MEAGKKSVGEEKMASPPPSCLEAVVVVGDESLESEKHVSIQYKAEQGELTCAPSRCL
jgi:hypothetical protein